MMDPCEHPDCYDGICTASADLAGLFWAEGDAIDVHTYPCPWCATDQSADRVGGAE